MLAQALDKLGLDLKRLKRHSEAQAAFEESIQILDGLVRRFPDWGSLAYHWIDVPTTWQSSLSMGSSLRGKFRQNKICFALLTRRCCAREFAVRFPEQHWAQVSFAKTLDLRGRYESNADRKKEAFPYHLEATDVYRKRILPDQESSGADDVTTYLSQLQSAADCANSLGNSDEVIRLSQLATQVLSRWSSPTGADDLGRVLFLAAKVHSAAGRYKDAIATHLQAIDVRRGPSESPLALVPGKQPGRRILGTRQRLSRDKRFSERSARES